MLFLHSLKMDVLRQNLVLFHKDSSFNKRRKFNKLRETLFFGKLTGSCLITNIARL